MVIPPKINAGVLYPRLNNIQAADPNSINSRRSLSGPGVGITVFPDLLGSSLTANTPHVTAKRAIISNANRMAIRESEREYPHFPKVIITTSSSRNLRAPLIGWIDMVFTF